MIIFIRAFQFFEKREKYSRLNAQQTVEVLQILLRIIRIYVYSFDVVIVSLVAFINEHSILRKKDTFVESQIYLLLLKVFELDHMLVLSVSAEIHAEKSVEKRKKRQRKNENE